MNTFRFKLWPTLFVLALFCLLVSLGCWQLKRYHYKKYLLQEFNLAMQAAPAPLHDVIKLTHPEFHRVQITGHYLNSKTILLANRLMEHQSGYDVITPFVISNEKQAVLVDRGFVPAQIAEHTDISAQQNIVTLTGYLKFPDKHAFILGPEILNKTFPLEVQKINIQKIENATQLKLFPFLIRLSHDESNGFYREWPITIMMPAQHLGYAIQWFLMALVLLIAYGFFVKHSLSRFAGEG